MVWDMKPADLLNLDEKKLKDMGVSEDRVAALIRNPWYSITAVTSLVNSLESLRGVKGRDQVVTFAAAIGAEDRARLAVEAVAMLARHHATVEPLVQVSAPGPIVARTKAGALLSLSRSLRSVDGAGRQVRRAAGVKAQARTSG